MEVPERALIALVGVVVVVVVALLAVAYAKICSHVLKPFKKYKIALIQSILHT